MSDEADHHIWIVTLPVGGAEVLIEQWGDDPPTLAFRADRRETWGRPHQSVEAW